MCAQGFTCDDSVPITPFYFSAIYAFVFPASQYQLSTTLTKLYMYDYK